nr:histidine phosphatase family protein [Corynebacterium sp. TAE3-ERU12]
MVRHGEVHNPDKILYGRLPDYHLSSRGVDQAHKTAESFANHDVTALYCSPLERTRETAAPISQVVGLEPQVRDKLIEAGNSFEGMRIKGLRSQLWNPKYWPRLRKPSIPSWGEPYTDIADRIFEVIAEARAAAEGHEAILVTHQLCVVAAARRARELPLAHNPANRQCELASVTSLIFQGENIIGVRYAEPAANI